MMWSYMLSGLACGARIVAYDGSPFVPDVRAFLKFISDQGSVSSSLASYQIKLLLNCQKQGDGIRHKPALFDRGPGSRDSPA